MMRPALYQKNIESSVNMLLSDSFFKIFLI